jgi:hypothetical protein
MVSGVLGKITLRLNQPQVELELGLSLAKIRHSLRDTFYGTPFITKHIITFFIKVPYCHNPTNNPKQLKTTFVGVVL